MSLDPLALLWPPPQRRSTLPGRWSRDAAPIARVDPAARVEPNGRVRRGGYRLRADSRGVEVVAASENARRHALATLAQAQRLCADDASAPAFEIEDWPDFESRGVLLDVSRTKVPTMETLFELVGWLAGLKYNQLQLYTEHTFAYRDHERVWRDASPLTADEVRALDERCRTLGIELVANQQSLGHLHRWLALDRYRHMAEVPEGVDHAFSRVCEPFSLCPTDPASLAFLGRLYDELLPNFGGRQLNVGLDETFDIGLGRSKSACEARGKGRVYLDHLRGVHRLAAERGRRIQFFGDVILEHPELIPELPRDAIALLWGYEADHPFAEQARAFAVSGLEFHVCPGTSSWQSVSGRTHNAALNLAAAAVAGRETGAAGYLVADWGDRGHLQPPFASCAGFLLGAGHAWNASSALGGGPDLAALLDTHAFHDPSRTLGRAAVDLGQLDRECGSKSTNGSALFFLLAFAAEPLPHARTPDLTVDGLERALAHAASSLRRLDAFRDARPEARAHAAEMRWAAELLAFACQLGIERLRAPRGAPLGAIPAPTRAALASELEPLIAEHRRLWLTRNRPGGLSESAGWLERVHALLR